MVTAIVLLSLKCDQINLTAERIADLDGVTEVYSITGEHDLAVMLRTTNNEALADLVTNKILRQEGILRSETLFAFRVYSRYDLETVAGITGTPIDDLKRVYETFVKTKRELESALMRAVVQPEMLEPAV